MKNNLKAGILVFTVLFAVSCNNEDKQNVKKSKPGKGQIETINTFLVEKDRDRIMNYISRKGLTMTESGSGLWYSVGNQGEGEKISDGSKVVFNYSVSLLDGTKCYSSEISGPKEIILGKSGIEAGLDEGLRMMNKGGRAIFIIPPFLAHGLLGDDNKIPPRATLVYEIEIFDK